MNSGNIGKPSLRERLNIGVTNLKGRFTGWDMRKIARVVLYAGGVIFVIVLVISAGRAPRTKTATTLTQAPAAFTINKWYDYAGAPTVKSGGVVDVHLRLRNPGQAQDATVQDHFPPNFTWAGSINTICPGITNFETSGFGGNSPVFKLKVPPTDNCEITYNLKVP